eukprot:IDg16527t1
MLNLLVRPPLTPVSLTANAACKLADFVFDGDLGVRHLFIFPACTKISSIPNAWTALQGVLGFHSSNSRVTITESYGKRATRFSDRFSSNDAKLCVRSLFG